MAMQAEHNAAQSSKLDSFIAEARAGFSNAENASEPERQSMATRCGLSASQLDVGREAWNAKFGKCPESGAYRCIRKESHDGCNHPKCSFWHPDTRLVATDVEDLPVQTQAWAVCFGGFRWTTCIPREPIALRTAAVKRLLESAGGGRKKHKGSTKRVSGPSGAQLPHSSLALAARS